jgi:hypothetical protein
VSSASMMSAHKSASADSIGVRPLSGGTI